jgi:hypothetical protein
MRRIAKPNTIIPPQAPEVQDAQPGFDLSDLLDKGAEILKREIRNLMLESSGKKLSPTSARDLVSYVKLLHELQLEEKKILAGLTDAELEKLVSNNTNNDDDS